MDIYTRIITQKDLDKLEHLCYYRVLLNRRFLAKDDALQQEEADRYTRAINDIEEALDRLFLKYGLMIKNSDTH